jgi:cephalosporin hydroxylase
MTILCGSLQFISTRRRKPEASQTIVSMNPIEEFNSLKARNIRALSEDSDLGKRSLEWMLGTAKYNYTYNFTWLGIPIIQFPQDMVALQEIIWSVKPDLIIETGIAHGGSIIFSASMLELLGRDGAVLGIDIDIREHNRVRIEAHPLAKRIRMIQGSSIAPEVAELARELAHERETIMVILDSNHTHEHVLKELELYGPLVTRGSYLVVFDTSIEDAPADFFPDRAWRKGHNPKTAVWEFLQSSDRFVIDKEIEDKLLITVAPDGYLRCVKD